MARGVAMAAAILSVGCYAYRPLGQPTRAAGAEVRATLATPISVQLGEITVQDVDRVEGLVYRATGDTVVISSSWVYTRLGSRYFANGGVFAFDGPQLRSLQVRRLSPARTSLAGLVTVGVAAAMFSGVKQALGGGGPPPPPSDGH